MLRNEIKDEYMNMICAKCKNADTPDAVGTKCYLCKRNPIDHRIDAYEPDFSKIYKSEKNGNEIMDVVTGCPCAMCNDYERRCCTVRCDEYDTWVRKLIK